MNATVGPYADYANFSDFDWGARCYCCGQKADWSGDHHSLCDGCHFRHTIMKAAGREDEFWAAAGKHESHDVVSNVAREMTYRMAQSVDAMVRATVDSDLVAFCTENE